jgi:hypothetical protein
MYIYTKYSLDDGLHFVHMYTGAHAYNTNRQGADNLI